MPYEMHCKWCNSSLDWDVMDHYCKKLKRIVSVKNGDPFRKSVYTEDKQEPEKQPINKTESQSSATDDLSYLGFLGGIQ